MNFRRMAPSMKDSPGEVEWSQEGEAPINGRHFFLFRLLGGMAEWVKALVCGGIGLLECNLFWGALVCWNFSEGISQRNLCLQSLFPISVFL